MNVDIYNMFQNILDEDLHPAIVNLTREVTQIERFSFGTVLLQDKRDILLALTNTSILLTNIIEGNEELDEDIVEGILTMVRKLTGNSLLTNIIVDTYGDALPEDSGSVNFIPPPELIGLTINSQEEQGFAPTGVYAQNVSLYPDGYTTVPGTSSILTAYGTLPWDVGDIAKFPTIEETEYPVIDVIVQNVGTGTVFNGLVPKLTLDNYNGITSTTPMFKYQVIDVHYFITVEWVGKENFKSYKIEKNGQVLTTVGGGSTTFTDHSVNRGDSLTYRVIGVDETTNEEVKSNSMFIQAYDLLSAPVLTDVVPSDSGPVSLTWSTVSTAVEYVIYRDDVPYGSTTVPNFVDNEVDGGTTYEYYVTSKAEDGAESNESNRVSVMALVPIPAITGSGIAYGANFDVTVGYALTHTYYDTIRLYRNGEFQADKTAGALPFSFDTQVLTKDEPTDFTFSATVAGGREGPQGSPLVAFPENDPDTIIHGWVNGLPSVMFTQSSQPWPLENKISFSYDYLGSAPVATQRIRFTGWDGEDFNEYTNNSSYTKIIDPNDWVPTYWRLYITLDLFDSSYVKLYSRMYTIRIEAPL